MDDDIPEVLPNLEEMHLNTISMYVSSTVVRMYPKLDGEKLWHVLHEVNDYHWNKRLSMARENPGLSIFCYIELEYFGETPGVSMRECCQT